MLAIAAEGDTVRRSQQQPEARILDSLLRVPQARATSDGKNVNYHRLHDLLSIGDDPSEDIFANVALNMEGI